eukprot:1910680-Karenia_brevis.AAC.1
MSKHDPEVTRYIAPYHLYASKTRHDLLDNCTIFQPFVSQDTLYVCSSQYRVIWQHQIAILQIVLPLFTKAR